MSGRMDGVLTVMPFTQLCKTIFITMVPTLLAHPNKWLPWSLLWLFLLYWPLLLKPSDQPPGRCHSCTPKCPVYKSRAKSGEYSLSPFQMLTHSRCRCSHRPTPSQGTLSFRLQKSELAPLKPPFIRVSAGRDESWEKCLHSAACRFSCRHPEGT